MNFICLLFPPLLVAGATAAVPVVVKQAGAVVTTAPAEIVARPMAYSGGTYPRGEVVTTTTSGEATLNLGAGTWTLVARRPGFWGPEETVLVDHGAGQAASVVLKLWPAGLVSGSLVAPADEALPDVVTVVFSLGGPSGDGFPREARIQCPVRDGQWSCELPARVLDLQVRVAAFVPHYVWDVKVTRDLRRDLGPMTLRRGASVAGWVTRADGQRPGPPCRVELTTPHGEPIKGPPPPAEGSGGPLRASVNQRGFFQITSVPVAHYLATASEGRLAADPQHVQVSADAETLIRDALVLTAPVTVDLVLDPPLDPWEKPWKVRLFRQRGHHVAPLGGEGSSSREGVWSREDLRPGSYIVMVLTEDGTRWFNETIDVTDGLGPVRIELPIMKVRGTLKVGKRPLSGAVIFGGRHGAVSVKLQADAEGKFAGLLPQERAKSQPWDVDIESSDPPVRRTIEQVVVAAAEGGEARIDLVLPETRLRGVVVDTESRPVKAIVDAQSTSEFASPTQVLTDEDGRFEFNGLVEGPHLLSAQGHGGLQSDQVVVTIGPGAAAPAVQLVVRERLAVNGRVVSPDGVVPGARIKATPAQAPIGMVPVVRSDSEGGFALLLPAGTAEVSLSVDAAGFAFKTFRTAVSPGAPLNVVLDRLGGKLVLEVPRSGNPPRAAPPIFIAHRGSVENVHYLLEADGAAVNEAGQMILPQMDAGSYAACAATPADYALLMRGVFPEQRCVTDTLAPGGELLLRVPGSSDSPRVKQP